MIDLWGLFVEHVFGSFYMAVFGIAVIYLLIMWFGNISVWSSMILIGVYLLAMSIGYGITIFSIIITIGIIVYFFYAWKGWIERGGGQ